MNALSPNIGMDIAEEATLRCLDFAMRRVDADYQHRRKEAARTAGVCVAGMDSSPVLAPTCRDYIAAAEASMQRQAALDADPHRSAIDKAGELIRFVRALYQQAEGVQSALGREDGSALAKISSLVVALADAGNLAQAVYSLEAEAAG